ncbi:aminoglycoside 3 phosphotransferase [Fusarium circinatum]|uniref:Aminoglycoside 3 phosphotransferase n=1 Tax=Fusarium circinatum TaxID=48490 RepID=A0A8H5TWC8_FUSCI|nr:aminoglycoside 3 phosphotransferase [Fusarium circinatum]
MATASAAAVWNASKSPEQLVEPFRKDGHAYRIRREAEAMKFVQSHTSMPVPAILETHFGSGYKEPSWIMMERVTGEQLDKSWPIMTVMAKERAITELRGYLAQLHRIRPNGSGRIGSCSGGPAYDHRLNNMSTCGPFSSIAEFNDFLVAPVRNCPRPEWVAKYRNQLRDDHDIHFAHADISGENILLDPTTGSITGIVDWEMAGFWPEWWEYRKALFGSRSREPWNGIVKQIMAAYDAETEVDMDLEIF